MAMKCLTGLGVVRHLNKVNETHQRRKDDGPETYHLRSGSWVAPVVQTLAHRCLDWRVCSCVALIIKVRL